MHLSRRPARNKYRDCSPNGIPFFPYHPNPLATGAAVEANERCDICGLVRKYLYAGAVVEPDNHANICFWCIADGGAAFSLDIEFNDLSEVPPHLEPATRKQIAILTPGTASSTPIPWVFHCRKPAIYHGPCDWNNLSECASIVDEMQASGWNTDALSSHITATGDDIEAHLFECTSCHTGLVHITDSPKTFPEDVTVEFPLPQADNQTTCC